ncbi:hypothetical protein CUMW_262550 [Citrus unshiu]|uniref:DEAD/DEAH box helicase domain-containing protein n=1 Tax=Citrus unshiu TaxID=55188 RepID=A0A2H5QUD2_CITUN|nr:hypothetical protein CUMW_262550 [Citrus unshiu]
MNVQSLSRNRYSLSTSRRNWVLRNQGEGAIVLVLAPTRDLADQIQEEAFKFWSCASVINTCVYEKLHLEISRCWLAVVMLEKQHQEIYRVRLSVSSTTNIVSLP